MKGEGTGSEIGMKKRVLTPKTEKAKRKGDKIKRKEE
jgi:hypothetical protein